MHALVLCDFTNNIWGQSNLSIPIIQTNNFHEWFGAILDILDTDGLMYVAAILYHIWRARNKAVWDAYLPRPKKVLMTATSALHAWRTVHHMAVQHATSAPAEPPHATTAQLGAPPPGLPPRRCYVDANYHHPTNTASVGAILLDGNGGYISAYASSLPSYFSPLMAEAVACKEALSWLKNRGEHSIELYTD
ncbi:PREDICTED: uncharacterized protein LOC109173051 [Ipomoea nil]|uniref:uncharacterized protein LOC109173051 n=1 Tax=Ipomoea nil TaxID=35883 RepID=UPI00090127AE|nr:PREDICTED: uncharacterized protein LOC109173051 [Ipomoea nil]